MDRQDVLFLIEQALKEERNRIASIIEVVGIVEGRTLSPLARFAERVADAVRDE